MEGRPELQRATEVFSRFQKTPKDPKRFQKVSNDDPSEFGAFGWHAETAVHRVLLHSVNVHNANIMCFEYAHTVYAFKQPSNSRCCSTGTHASYPLGLLISLTFLSPNNDHLTEDSQIETLNSRLSNGTR